MAPGRDLLIGRLEGKMDTVLSNIKDQGTKIDSIEAKISVLSASCPVLNGQSTDCESHKKSLKTKAKEAIPAGVFISVVMALIEIIKLAITSKP